MMSLLLLFDCIVTYIVQSNRNKCANSIKKNEISTRS